MESTDGVLSEQVQYYRARAAEYDEWWDRRGRYDRGPDATPRWFAERDQITGALSRLELRGDVLELACGTGIWTERLIETARSVTAVDASPEMLELNRERLVLSATRVTYVLADLFTWRPDHAYDAVVFCFWLSHVPRARLGDFLQLAAGAVRPGGRVFFVDSKCEGTSMASNHVQPTPGQEVMTRLLNDGSAFQVIKNFWLPTELEQACAAAGLAVSVSETPTYFLYGIGERVT
jgi:2-polyprenyl-3-methyl-5-hydroxy-6-metoxy-1,4-benzoquinol methylase